MVVECRSTSERKNTDTNKKGQQDQHVTTVQGSQRGSKQISSHCKGARI